MKADLKQIEKIQADTFIHNYHPFLTAINFTINEIESKLQKVDVFEDVTQYVCDLKTYFKKFKSNIVWCKKYQPYLVQLRFNFSCITFGDCEFKTYCPSSFCRPLRFKDLDEQTVAYASKVAFLENESKNLRNRKMILEAKSKISNMERKNMEQMGLFITITTFLVGLLSIFIGNNGNVSITEKMMYVIALGNILIIFVCLGYFAVRDKYDKTKCWLFGILMILSALSICIICRYTPVEKNANPRNNPQTQVKKGNNQFVIKNNN